MGAVNHKGISFASTDDTARINKQTKRKFCYVFKYFIASRFTVTVIDCVETVYIYYHCICLSVLVVKVKLSGIVVEEFLVV